jgi:Tol biopolymer transport system component
MASDGTDWHLLTRNLVDYKTSHPDWSPDGKVIAFTQFSPDQPISSWPATVKYSHSGSLPVAVIRDFPMSEQRFSADGFWLVFQGFNDTVYRHLYIMTPNGVNRQQITSGDSNDFDPAWKPGS